MQIDKSQILQLLKSRGDHGRTAWAEFGTCSGRFGETSVPSELWVAQVRACTADSTDL
ncbi:MAG: hypothetical protein ACXVXJ_10850 [Mycobacteriaceae bacterium]